MKISIITMTGPEDIAYGKDNRLLKRLSVYLKYFDKIMTSELLIMNKDDYERVCYSRRRLFGTTIPGKKIVIFSETSPIEYANKNIICATSVDDALSIALANSSEVIIVGDNFIHQAFFHLTTRIYLIHPFGNFYGCKNIVDFKQKDWEITHRWHQPVREPNPFSFSFKVFERKKQIGDGEEKTLKDLCI